MINKPQKQYSLREQLNNLIDLANKEGLYDAADWVIKAINEQDRFIAEINNKGAKEKS